MTPIIQITVEEVCIDYLEMPLVYHKEKIGNFNVVSQIVLDIRSFW